MCCRNAKRAAGMLSLLQDSSMSPAAIIRTNNKTRSKNKLEIGASQYQFVH